MVRKRKQRKDPASPIGVKLHPELHRALAHEAIDAGRTLQEHLHIVLCGAIGRADLMPQEMASPA